MKNNTSKKIKRLALVLLMVILVSLSIFIVENAAKNEGFNNIFDAIWYMLVTLSTVGYGDIYPKTIIGRLLASVLVILTPVILIYILNVIWDLLAGNIILRLYLSKKNHWYIFDELNNESKRVIDSVLLNKNNDYIVVCKSVNKEVEYLSNEYIDNKKVFNIDLEYSYFIKKNSEVKIFLISKGNDADKLAKAKSIESKVHELNKNVNIYVTSNMHFDYISNNIHVFNVHKAIAQSLINEFNKEFKDENIILAGEGEIFEYIFENLIINNVYNNNQMNEYYIVENSENFKKKHYKILDYINNTEKESFRDKIILINDLYDRTILGKANTILLCYEDNKNIEILNDINKYFNNHANIYIKYSNNIDIQIDRIKFFGNNEEIFTYDKIVNESLYDNAKKLNDKYKKMYGGKGWEELESFKKESNIASCNHLNVKMRIVDEMTSNKEDSYINKYNNLSKEEKFKLYEIEHERWSRFHYIYNWEYAEKRNDADRKHNLLVPFYKLSEEDKVKNEQSYMPLSVNE